MKLMLVTADPEVASDAARAGVDRMFVDLEYINKSERQRGRNTLISSNSVEDVRRVREAVPDSELLVRVNPVNPGLRGEVDQVIELGADVVMLPMVLDADDARTFVAYVRARARTCLLLETAQAVARVDDILAVDGVDEVYIGLNDMHISMGLEFMFELLSGGIVEYICSKASALGIPYGFGGIARIGEGLLPAELILGEHFRLGSSSVILSRTFRGETEDGASALNLSTEVEKIRACEREIAEWSQQDFARNRLFVKARVHEIAHGLRTN